MGLFDSDSANIMLQPVERFATVNGLRIHYIEWGARGRQPLILLHRPSDHVSAKEACHRHGATST